MVVQKSPKGSMENPKNKDFGNPAVV